MSNDGLSWDKRVADSSRELINDMDQATSGKPPEEIVAKSSEDLPSYGETMLSEVQPPEEVTSRRSFFFRWGSVLRNPLGDDWMPIDARWVEGGVVIDYIEIASLGPKE